MRSRRALLQAGTSLAAFTALPATAQSTTAQPAPARTAGRTLRVAFPVAETGCCRPTSAR
ncbi:MAG: hypothetical protein MUC68_13775 [Burkholderiaceae bacterium]|nr:hypothetical protein [Burkholderiaceae bacterium]